LFCCDDFFELMPLSGVPFMKKDRMMFRGAVTLLLPLILIITPARADILIGVGVPLSGAQAAVGQQILKGVQLAVEDLNAVGGLNGEKILITSGDDQADPKQGGVVAKKFINDGVKIVIGHATSNVSLDTSELYQEKNILMISPSAINPKLTERGLWNVVRVASRDDHQAAVAAGYIKDHFDNKKIAFAHDRSNSGQTLADATRKKIGLLGLREILFEGVSISEKDFSPLITKLKTEQADLLYWGGSYLEAGLLIKQMREQGLKTVLMSGDMIASDEVALIAGMGAEGTVMTFPLPARARLEAKDIIKKLESKNIEPESYLLNAYASVQILADAARKIKSTDTKKLAEELRSGTNFKTVIGEISFDKQGDRTRSDYAIFVWKKSGDKIVFSAVE
jgi:branched-chain amino acid transport system substrate-binding protein